MSNAICAESVVPEEYHEYIYTIYIYIYTYICQYKSHFEFVQILEYFLTSDCIGTCDVRDNDSASVTISRNDGPIIVHRQDQSPGHIEERVPPR